MENKKKCVHVISHSHWDREWYLPFEQHRMRLIELIDNCMEMFEKDPEFKSFHLDGQTIAIDDYLEIRPENKEKIIKYIKEGKFIVGPFYILQDEFMTSGEANVRNILVGMKSAREYGGICRAGYFPDAFGNAGQMPQLLKQAGMEAVVFGRGVKPTGFNNEISESGDYESAYSEMIWQSPDGSELLGILFANWYNNGNEIPADTETAKKYWDWSLDATGRFASTGELLIMNGCDHQPVQTDIGKAIETAKALYPEIEFKHSNFPDYIKAVKENLPENISVIKGELTSQQTDGWVTLVNTTSARVDLKQMNRRCESALENLAEPLSVMAARYGKVYPHSELTYAWKVLMQNHPHDSICSCSVDPVNAEVKTRFNKSRQTAEYLADEALEYIANKIDTSVFEKHSDRVIPFTVFNTTGRERDGVISVELDFERRPAPLRKSAEELDDVPMPEFALIDTNGKRIPCTIEDRGVNFGYTLPKDRFRQSYMARTVKVTFEAKKIPAVGYKTYALAEMKNQAENISLIKENNSMENDRIRVEINLDGSLNVFDKLSGREYNRIGWYEETGDFGNEYIYKRPNGTEPISTLGTKAEIICVEDTPYRASYKVTHILTVPESGDEVFENEKRHMVDFRDRRGGRSKKTVDVKIEAYVSLEESGKGVKVKTVIDNTAKDHRIRIMVPTGIDSDTHEADSTFELVTRNNRHNASWKNPSTCEHQQGFVSIDDGKAGIAVANIGLYEYEMLPDTDNTIAVTLLRAVGEMGDWGVFPTPDAQMLTTVETEVEIVPFAGNITDSLAYEECYRLRCDMPAFVKYAGTNELPAEDSMLTWSGTGLTLTGIKRKEDSPDIILRWVNLKPENAVLKIKKAGLVTNLYQSNIIEENLGAINARDGEYEITVKPYEIATFGTEG